MSLAENYALEPNTGCWLWLGHVRPNGYGQVWSPKERRLVGAHRAMYEHLIGPVPKTLDLDHLCRVRCCVNPAHLEPVSRSENLRRGLGTRKTHCKRGHDLATSRYSGGGCAPCARERAKRRHSCLR